MSFDQRHICPHEVVAPLSGPDIVLRVCGLIDSQQLFEEVWTFLAKHLL
jgi:hypothetical protein